MTSDRASRRRGSCPRAARAARGAHQVRRRRLGRRPADRRAGPRRRPLHRVRPGRRQARTPRSCPAGQAEGKALYDVSCVTCHGRNAQGVADRGPEPDRGRLGRGGVPGRHRSDADGPPGGAGRAQAAELHRRRRQTARPVHPGARRWPAAARRRRPPRAAATAWPTAASCSGSTARRATRSVAAAARCPRASTRPRSATATDRADLRRDADRPAEHAGVRRQPAHRRRRRRTSSPTSRR